MLKMTSLNTCSDTCPTTTAIAAALKKAGYDHMQPTEDNLKECFIDYVDAGYWWNIDAEDVENITISEMIQAFK